MAGRRVGLERIVTRIQTNLRSGSRWRLFGIIYRNIRFVLRIKIDGRNLVEHTYRLLDRGKDDLPDGLFVLKLDFGLRRMDVDINILRVYFEVEEIRNLFSQRNQTVEGRHHRLIEVRMLHISAIDEEELVNTLLAGSLRFTDETGNLAHGSLDIHRQQLMIESLAEDIQDALAQIGSTEIENLGLIAAQREVDLRIHQGDTLESSKDIIQLGRIRLQKLPSCGYIIEYIIDGEVTSHRTGAWLLLLET